MKTTSSKSLSCGALALALSFIVGVQVHAGTVSYTDIHQSAQTTGDPANLYGAPTLTTPNKLIFKGPSSFSATATGAGGADTTDGFLSFSVSVDDPNTTWATGFSFSDEIGAWSLRESVSGFAGAGTNVSNTIVGALTITGVNGVAVNGPTLPLNGNGVYFSALTDPPVTPPGSSGGLWSNIASVALPVGQYGRVTSFDVAINDTLTAFSEGGPNGTSISLIDKKRIVANTQTGMVPEPTSVALAGLAMCGLGLVTRKRR